MIPPYNNSKPTSPKLKAIQKQTRNQEFSSRFSELGLIPFLGSCSLDHLSKMGMIKNHNLEWKSDDDEQDDIFYAELRRQILNLTAEEEDVLHVSGRERCGSGSRSSVGKFCCESQPGSYFSWRGSEDCDVVVPTWLVNLWGNNGIGNGNGNGTGVFIPQIVKSRRRYRPGKMNKGRSRAYKQVEKALTYAL